MSSTRHQEPFVFEASDLSVDARVLEDSHSRFVKTMSRLFSSEYQARSN